VIGAADAKLIGATRVGDVELAAVANALGISDKVCHQPRRRAESVLVVWLSSDRYSPFEFVFKVVRTSDQQPVMALAPCGVQESMGKRVAPRGASRRVGRLNAG